MDLKKRLISCIVGLTLFGLATNARGQPVADNVMSRAEDFLTSYVSVTAGAIRYSDPVYVGDCQWIFFAYTLSGCGASTPIGVAIQWLEEDFTRANAQWDAGTAGYQLSSGWASTVDSQTSHTRTSSGDFLTSSPVKAPFCRLAFNPEHADDGDGHITAYYYKRYSPLPNHYTELFVDNGFWSGADVVSWTDLHAMDDLIANDDVTIGDDGYIGDNLDIDGLLTVDESITATTTIQGADLVATDDLAIADDGYIGDNLDIDGLLTVDETIACSGPVTLGTGSTPLVNVVLTSGTIAAGASSVTLTLPTGYAVASHRVQWSVVPAIAGSAYAGHADDYFHWEGGTTCEIRISSATFINLVAELRVERLW